MDHNPDSGEVFLTIGCPALGHWAYLHLTNPFSLVGQDEQLTDGWEERKVHYIVVVARSTSCDRILASTGIAFFVNFQDILGQKKFMAL